MAILQDSGNRREFETGAVRDVAEGKGRCDLLPLDVVGILLYKSVPRQVHLYTKTGNTEFLYDALRLFAVERNTSEARDMLLVSHHFEDGMVKYGENNWRRGIPLHCYIDSAIRHYLKDLIGENDEPHEAAFIWNILCAIWTHENRPEMIDLPFATKEG